MRTLINRLDRCDWHIFTAANPAYVLVDDHWVEDPQTLSEEENAARNAELMKQIKKIQAKRDKAEERAKANGKPTKGLPRITVEPARGVYGHTPEPSLMVTGLSVNEALELAGTWGQASITTPTGVAFTNGEFVPFKAEIPQVGTDLDDNYTEVMVDGVPVRFSYPVDFDESFPIKVAGLKVGISAKATAYLTSRERQKIELKTAQAIVDWLGKLPNPEEMASVAWAGRAKRGWYERSARAIVEIFGEDSPRFAALLAALSPQCSVEDNLGNTLRTWNNWLKAGRPTDYDSIVEIMGQSVQGDKGTDSVLEAWVNNAVRALTNDPIEMILSGPKVDSFRLNLLGNTIEVTNDTWMANYAGISQKRLQGKLLTSGKDPGKGTAYLAMNIMARKAAKVLTERTGEKWTASEIQETVWSWARSLWYAASQTKAKGDENFLTHFLSLGKLTAQDIASTPDFEVLFTTEIYENILKEAGYDDQLAEVRRLVAIGARNGQADGGGGNPAWAPGAGIDRATYDRHLQDAASRLSKGNTELNLIEEQKHSHFNQAGPAQIRRASVLFGQGEIVVTLFQKAADRSSFVHEVGHIMLELLKADATGDEVDPQVAHDYWQIKQWLGVKGDEPLTTEQHERFARGFEAYLMEGKAPVVGLRRVFGLFKDWLVGIYREMANLNVQVTPEVSEVFDRLIATDDQIQATKELDGFNDLLAQEAGVLSEPETVFMKSLAEQAEAEAEERLRKKALKDVEFERKAAKETRRLELTQEIRKEVERDPVHKLRQALRLPRKQGGARISLESAIEAMEDLVQRMGWDEGTAANQAADAQLQEMRDRREEIRKDLRGVKKALQQAENEKAPKGRINYLKSRMHALENDIATINDQVKNVAKFEKGTRKDIPSLPRNWFVNEGGMDIELLAHEHGYTSGSEMIEDLLSAPELEDDVRVRVENRLEIEFPVTSQEELAEEANRALHNKHRLEFLAVERLILARMTKREMKLQEAKARVQAARKAALKILGLKRWKDAGNWKRFLAAERRAQKAVERAVLAGDYETALALKDTQILQHALCTEAMGIADENARMLRLLKKYANRGRTDTFGLPADYLDQIDGILEGVSFRPVRLLSAIDPQTGERLKGGAEAEREVRAALSKWAAEQEAQGFPVDIPEHILQEINRKP